MNTETAPRGTESATPNAHMRIMQEIAEKVQYYAMQPEQIEERLRELDQEWDVERTLEMNAAIACLTGVILGSTVSRKWYALSGIVAGFLFQHALQGWCPPLPLLRQMGVRTQEEIDHERYLLKAVRGDFTRICMAKDTQSREAAAIEAITRH